MELRKDPITRSWVVTHDGAERLPRDAQDCPFCPGSSASPHVVGSMPSVSGGPWSAQAVVHPNPLFRIEGDPSRSGNGLYDLMHAVGAHEVIVENTSHTRQLWESSDAEIAQFLKLVGHRIQDLKRDQRFKFITVSKDQGSVAGQEFEHPTSQITATTFVPRRVLYELRASREYYEQKERCVFCDILGQEERQAVRMIETRGDYVAMCPYAPRVPYETWVLPRHHEAAFEREVLRRENLSDLASLLRRTLRRITSLADAFHMVLHTLPNTVRTPDILGYWRTIEEDYHWHIEILPVLPGKSKSYRFKETYHTDVTPETAASRLRAAPAE